MQSADHPFRYQVWAGSGSSRGAAGEPACKMIQHAAASGFSLHPSLDRWHFEQANNLSAQVQAGQWSHNSHRVLVLVSTHMPSGKKEGKTTGFLLLQSVIPCLFLITHRFSRCKSNVHVDPEPTVCQPLEAHLSITSLSEAAKYENTGKWHFPKLEDCAANRRDTFIYTENDPANHIQLLMLQALENCLLNEAG